MYLRSLLNPKYHTMRFKPVCFVKSKYFRLIDSVIFSFTAFPKSSFISFFVLFPTKVIQDVIFLERFLVYNKIELEIEISHIRPPAHTHACLFPVTNFTRQDGIDLLTFYAG